MDVPTSPAIEQEIARATGLGRQMLGSYVAWWDDVKWGEISLATYSDIIDFLNFRMETADTCLSLIEQDKVGDALGLCRSLLEYYLLFVLICRGNKWFQVWDLSEKEPDEFAEILKEQQKRLAELRETGKTNCVEVRKHPRAKRHIIMIYDGLVFDDGEKLPVSMYFFHFEEFSPETMRLNQDDYFEYYEPGADVKKSLKGHRQEAQLKYRHFLSYDGLLMCLALNNLVDEAAISRIEAHYTFLGKCLHPSKDAMRDLRERSNWYNGQPVIGKEHPYTQTARLLATAYVNYLIAGMLEEFAGLMEAAPKKYVADAGTSALRDTIGVVARTMPYFWFIYNNATPYDKFNWAVHHATDEQLKEYGGYANLPSELITFNQHIYSNFASGLGGWSNKRVGVYAPPIS